MKMPYDAFGAGIQSTASGAGFAKNSRVSKERDGEHRAKQLLGGSWNHHITSFTILRGCPSALFRFWSTHDVYTALH